MASIYKIQFKNPNKIYIGSTIQNFNKRRNVHLCRLRKNIHTNKHLQNSFNKYGEKSFNFEIIEKIDNFKIAIERETYWYYEFQKRGYKLYNCYPPENPPMLGKHHSKEAKRKLSKINKGKNHPMYGKKQSKETCEKKSKILKGKYVGKNHPMYGKHSSKKSNLKNAISSGAKPFYILKDNKIIAECINQRECAKSLNLNSYHINECLHKHRKTHMGYVFKYAS